jgi:type III secretion protein T
MSALNPVDAFGNGALGVALTLPRIGAAFLVLPLFTSETVPALVRNSFFVSLAIVAYPVAATVAPLTQMAGHAFWPFVILKELFIGLVLGFAFGSVFWAIGAAGNLIDTKVGTNFASVVDPIQGHQTSLTASLLSQLASWLFMASGAFTVFLDLLMNSYAVWPVTQYLPRMSAASGEFFVDQFRYMMTLALLLAAPALVVMSVIDLSLGLINRYAQQLNVFTLTMPIKAWVGTWVLLLSLGTLIEVLLHKLFDNKALLDALEKLM